MKLAVLLWITTLGFGSKWALAADQMSLYHQAFENIRGFGQFKAKSMIGSPSLWVVFQPDCQSCKSQFKDLNCISDTIKKVALGFKGSKEELFEATRFLNFNGPQILASSGLEKKLNIQGTPVLLFVNQSGHIFKKRTGLLSCEALNVIFEEELKKTM